MYVEVSPGLSMISDSDTSGGFFASPDIEYDRGFAIGGALGYQIQDQVRAEASLSYRTADVDQVGGISAGASGDVNVTSLMANVYYDFDLGLPVTPYLGAGLAWLGSTWMRSSAASRPRTTTIPRFPSA